METRRVISGDYDGRISFKYNANTDVTIPFNVRKDAGQLEQWLQGKEYSMHYLYVERASYRDVQRAFTLIRLPNGNDAVLFKLFFHEGD